MVTPPTAPQLDALLGTADRRRLTTDEAALLRAGVRQLRASLAGAGAAVRRAPSGAYHQQVVHRAEQAEARITAVRALHQRFENRCGDCYNPDYPEPWPCPTIRALDDTALTLRTIRHYAHPVPGPTDAEIREQVTAIIAPALTDGCPSTYEALYPDRHTVKCGLPTGHRGQHYTADRELTWHRHQPTGHCPACEVPR
ncbi:hypothetical protein [Kitasatospora purpeofusca]|uniref:hypothetical protein n=1 Tax=Kitasatospora purpeofusca TaxID=67352 RepID=UPI003661EF56